MINEAKTLLDRLTNIVAQFKPEDVQELKSEPVS